MDSIINFLAFLNENWIYILICIGIIVGIIQKTISYFEKSTKEKIEIAKSQVKEILLKMVADAEAEYSDILDAGKIKRSKVISNIFDQFPILSKAIDQDNLISWIDSEIDNSLDTLHSIIDSN